MKPENKKQWTVQQLRTDQEGARKLLHDLEGDVLEELWRNPRKGMVVRDVHAALEANRKIAYTTVMTTLDRLWKKGVLRREKSGKAYLYFPLQDRATFYQQAAQQVFHCLLPEATEPLLASFVDSAATLDEAHLDKLEDLIQKKRQELQDRDQLS